MRLQRLRLASSSQVVTFSSQLCRRSLRNFLHISVDFYQLIMLRVSHVREAKASPPVTTATLHSPRAIRFAASSTSLIGWFPPCLL